MEHSPRSDGLTNNRMPPNHSRIFKHNAPQKIVAFYPEKSCVQIRRVKIHA